MVSGCICLLLSCAAKLVRSFIDDLMRFDFSSSMQPQCCGRFGSLSFFTNVNGHETKMEPLVEDSRVTCRVVSLASQIPCTTVPANRATVLIVLVMVMVVI